ncbi:MAG: restriction endonuclease subunit S, partial [Helicobacter sp.]|nr:restriction endonuclease subunit S [Helicobacter sp.]
MSNNPFQNLPQGWEVKTLGEVCEIISKGATPKIQKLYKTYNNDAIFLKAENITINGEINFNNVKFIDYETHTQTLRRSILKNNDVLITIVGSLARCAIIEKNNEVQINLNQAIAFARLKV